ncbi:unnamed protein product [Clonostachys rhizophaga]|uniref:Cellulose-binding protein n=1 Tax=Clonostachys rhizophaga TaxID=160324 RepID=A0A9N9VG06_9HYPO|nr:unnamed protein product [Clonostachys rhizophaga]
MASTLLSFASKPRVFILTDITNEPDDTQSFCRYLTYSNQFDTEGVVPVTSTWLRDRVAPEALHQVVNGYEAVVDNLNAHAHPDSQYPSADTVRSLIKPGAPVYGMEAVGDDIPLSPGGELLLESVLKQDDRPLWVLVWGGTNVLASVLHRIRDRPDAKELRAKLRVYTISDQDDTGSWIRQQWPEIFYICAVHGWNQYFSAGWLGITSDLGEHGGPDQSIVSNEWLRKHIQIGPLGKEYPDVEYGMEGDTPTFLYLIQNGLGVPEQPSWGSWGGRFLPVNVSDKGLPKQGHIADAADKVKGMNGKDYISNKATIWRWRSAFQNDFAARMQWTLNSDFSKVNHSPIAVVNGNKGLDTVFIDVKAGTTIVVDASESYDPDGDAIFFNWFQYHEPSAIHYFHLFEVVDLGIKPLENGKIVEVTVPPAEKSCYIERQKRAVEQGSPLHLILEVKDNGTPQMTSYRRIVIQPFRGEAP